MILLSAASSSILFCKLRGSISQILHKFIWKVVRSESPPMVSPDTNKTTVVPTQRPIPKPRRPVDLYLKATYATVRKQFPTKSKETVQNECRRNWTRLTPDERRPYQTAADGLKQRYRAKLLESGIPYRPILARMHFLRDHFAEFSRLHPTVHPQQLSGLIHQAYNQLSDTEKRTYQEREQAERRRYYLECQRAPEAAQRIKYRKTEQDQEEKWRRILNVPPGKRVSNRQKLTFRRQLGMPDKAPGTFFLYCRAVYGQSTTEEKKKVIINAREVSKRWSELPADQRAPYEREHERLSIQYRRQLTEWKAKMTADGRRELMDFVVRKVTATPYRQEKNRRNWLQRRNAVAETVLT